MRANHSSMFTHQSSPAFANDTIWLLKLFGFVLLTGSSCPLWELLCSVDTLRFTRPILFQPTTFFPLFIVTRANSTAARCRKSERLKDAGENLTCARFRCEEGEIAERTLPIVSARVSSSSYATVVPIHTAGSHAGSNATSFYCSRCPLVMEAGVFNRRSPRDVYVQSGSASFPSVKRLRACTPLCAREFRWTT